ncbi:sensor histidine kinase [Piscinibacter sp. XHJ-5]|uniref:sensor histidine kinase n=1 Tax=Piscinibacter sp. XHJ-5 TaxID=3037797 RepID=UPI0024535EE8|nr:sensor histidine kinase [Piscinibacter sp. XHJ-5]
MLSAQAATPASDARALGALGDAVALIDGRSRTVRWTSEAWLVLQPALGAGTTLHALAQALPGLGEAYDARPRDGRTRQLLLGESHEWDAQLATLADGDLLLRLADRREKGRALQRQLDDREQLLFTSRVISVGEMATTLAHELNQPIGAAANLLRGLRSRVSRRGAALDRDEATALDRAIEQVMFAARVIARIREFTHSRQPRHARVDLSALLQSSAALLDWDVQRSGARLSLSLPEAPAQVRGDEVMLQQVIVNLVRNALDALRTDPPEEPQVALRLELRASDVEVQVRDNGCGLCDETARQLFVPFASSKPSGMGIGLSICRSFVELHQGRLWFSRNADRGATFHLSLPRMAVPE